MAIDGGSLPAQSEQTGDGPVMVTYPSPHLGFAAEQQRDMRMHADQQRLDGMRPRAGSLRVADPARPRRPGP